MHEYVFIDPKKALQPQIKSKLQLKAPRAAKGDVPKLKMVVGNFLNYVFHYIDVQQISPCKNIFSVYWRLQSNVWL